MLSRTVNELNKSKMPAYKDATVCDEWLIYSNFKKWFDNPNNGYIEGYGLDKDILSRYMLFYPTRNKFAYKMPEKA